MTEEQLRQVLAETRAAADQSLAHPLRLEARYYLGHAMRLAEKHSRSAGIAACFGRMRARKALRSYGQIIAKREAQRLGL